MPRKKYRPPPATPPRFVKTIRGSTDGFKPLADSLKQPADGLKHRPDRLKSRPDGFKTRPDACQWPSDTLKSAADGLKHRPDAGAAPFHAVGDPFQAITCLPEREIGLSAPQAAPAATGGRLLGPERGETLRSPQ